MVVMKWVAAYFERGHRGKNARKPNRPPNVLRLMKSIRKTLKFLCLLSGIWEGPLLDMPYLLMNGFIRPFSARGVEWLY